MSFKKRLAMLSGALALAPALLLVVPTTAAWASGTGCNDNSLYTCIHVQGSGLYVDYIGVSTANQTNGAVSGLHFELHGPNGLIKNFPTFTAPYLGGSGYYKWTRNGNVRGGNYCATLWQDVGGTYYNDGTACLNVHK